MDTPTYEQKPIESDMHAIAAEIERNREHNESNNIEGVNAVKEAIRSFPQLNGGVPRPAAPVAPQAAADANSPLPAYAATAAPEVKREIEYLIDVAFTHGIDKALSASGKSPYFVQDAFHDALAGKLYPELQKRGLVK